MAEPFKILVCGEGGQGVLSIAKIAAYAGWLQGKPSVYVPYFTTEKRGGVSIAFAQIGDEPIPFPKFAKADLAVAMSQRAVDRIMPYLKDGTKIIVNSFLVKDLSPIAKWRPLAIDATGIAKNELKKPRTFNMLILDAVMALLDSKDRTNVVETRGGQMFLSVEFGKALEKTFHGKYERDPGLKELNEKALAMGYELAK